MPLFEDPANFSKSRLKSDLIAHNVSLPPANSKKQVYVELHLKHIEQRNAADFSSDEEDQEQDMPNKNKALDDADAPDPRFLTDDDLKAALLKHGITVGPIVASTRALYEKKLRRLLRSGREENVNGERENELYSDTEEEEESSEATEDEKIIKRPVRSQQQSSQNGGFVYPQCFLPSSRMRAHGYKTREPSPKRNLWNSLKSSDRSQSHCSQIPAGISRASFVDQHSGLGSWVSSGSELKLSSKTFSIAQMVEEESYSNVMESRRSFSTSTDIERELNGSNVEEHWSRSNGLDTPLGDMDTAENTSLFYTPQAFPSKYGTKVLVKFVNNVVRDPVPDTTATPTGIYATARRPIKGAAGRPIQHVHPDTPTSPTTLERQEVERRLVPIYIQILVFLIVVAVLYLISVYAEGSSLTTLLDRLSLWSDGDEWHWNQAETKDPSALRELE